MCIDGYLNCTFNAFISIVFNGEFQILYCVCMSAHMNSNDYEEGSQLLACLVLVPRACINGANGTNLRQQNCTTLHQGPRVTT